MTTLKKSKEFEKENIVYEDLRDLSVVLDKFKSAYINNSYHKGDLIKWLCNIINCVDNTLQTRETKLIPFRTRDEVWEEDSNK